MPRRTARLLDRALSDAEQVDDEYQRLAGQLMARTGRAVCLRGRDDELAPPADLHAGNTVLPTLNQAAQRKLDRLATVPGTVEFLTRVVFDADVMHFDGATGDCLGAVADDDVGDEELGRSGTVRKIDLGFLVVGHDHHRSRADWTGGQGPRHPRTGKPARLRGEGAPQQAPAPRDRRDRGAPAASLPRGTARPVLGSASAAPRLARNRPGSGSGQRPTRRPGRGVSG